MKRLILLTATAVLALVPAAPAQQDPPSYVDAAGLVDSWYQRFLGRTARTDRGSNLWVTQLVQGSTPDAVLAGILSSNEYYNKGGGRPEGFVNSLFRDLLGRRPTEREFDYWVRRVYTQNPDDLQTRQDVAYDVLTHNPGSWRGAAPPAPVPQPHDRYDYDYRRPQYPYRR